jgi:hypothetical protein
MKHQDVRWNPANEEWFCAMCGRTSDHHVKQDAQWEFEQFECSPPAVYAVPRAGKEEGRAKLVSILGSHQEYRVVYRLEQITDEPETFAVRPPVITALDISSLEGVTIPDGEYFLHAKSGTLHAHKHAGQWTASWGR